MQGRHEQLVAWLAILFAMTVLMSLIGLPFWNPLVARAGLFSWILYPLLAFGAVLGLLVALFATGTIVIAIRNWRLRFERPVLARARKCAREEGTIARIGPLTIWWSGPIDPVPLVTEQMETICKRFERLVDQPVDARALRVLVFHQRRAFIDFHRNVVADTGTIDSVYSAGPARLFTLTTGVPRFRLIDDARSLRSGLVLYLLETLIEALPSPWLQFGLSGALSADPGSDAREQLLRRMKVAIQNDTTVKVDQLFSRLSVLQTHELASPLIDHDRFALFAQWRAQSRSVIEHLTGSEAPPDRLGRFRSFLCDLKAAPLEEAVFKRHFGYSFEALLEHWQAWVDEQSLGGDPIPPPEVRIAIIDRLVPAIIDRSKKAHDRIVAMRSLGLTGFVLGADTLIDVLRERDDRFTPTATWALESISGLPLGSNADWWSDWWSTHGRIVRGDLDRAEPIAAAPAIAPLAPP